MRALVLLVGFALACGVLVAASPASAQTGYVRVDAPAGGALGLVVVDGAQAGRPGDVLAVPADSATTVALVEAGAAWNPRRAEVTVSVPAGDTLAVGLALPERYRVETLPLGARVRLDRPDGAAQLLGEAPLTVDLAPGTAGTLVATLDGYAEARLALDGRAGVPVTLVLAPDGTAPGTVPVTVLTTERSGRGRALIDAAVGALTLGAGAFAVVTKFRADRIDDRYRDPASAERGSESLRAEAQRLDRFSLVALGAMQVGVGVLAVRLVLR
jgi:hypothetical protein